MTFFMIRAILCLCIAVFAPMVNPDGARSQITLDGTIGPKVELSGPNYQIAAGLGKQTGKNLFHSFGQFNLGTGEAATFFGPDAVQNIIARVTGGNRSIINGWIRSEIQNADLYFLNPAGFLFGPRASLDISGSFHISTADYLSLGQGGQFHATYVDDTVLTSAPPSAFGFLDTDPGPVTFQGSTNLSSEGNMSASPDRHMGVVGGDISFENSFMLGQFSDEKHLWGRPSGAVSLVSVASPGEAVITEAGADISSFEAGGTISMSGGSKIDVRGTRDSTGSIFIRAGRFVMKDADTILLSHNGTSTGGKIDLGVEQDILIADSGYIATLTDGKGDAGHIDIAANRLEIENSAKVYSVSLGTGKAGDITITAEKELSLSSNGGILSQGEREHSDSGNIRVSTGRLTISDGANISTAAMKTAGDAGKIDLRATTIEILNGGVLNATAHGAGRPGDISLNVSHMATISGRESGIYADAAGAGAGGVININASHLSIDQGGILQNSTWGSGTGGDTTIFADTFRVADNGSVKCQALGTGDGGNIGVDVAHMVVANGGYVSTATKKSAMGGDIVIHARGDISVSRSGQIATMSDGAGDAGGLTIEADTLTISNEALLNTGSQGHGQAGNIDIRTNDIVISKGFITSSGVSPDSYRAGNIDIIAKDSVSITGSGEVAADSPAPYYGIYAQTHGLGGGGEISLSTSNLHMSQDAWINTQTYGYGRGGDISVDADQVNIHGGATLTTSTRGAGDAGDIFISAVDAIHLSGSGEKQDKSRIYSATHSGGSGGTIRIATPELSVGKNGEVISDTLDDDTYDGSILEPGTAGDIVIQTELTELHQGGTISVKSQSTASGGDIRVDTHHLYLFDNGLISAKSEDIGNAGDIQLKASGSIQMENSNMTTATNKADGGNIFINSHGIFHPIKSNITVTVGGGQGDGGNIDLLSDQIVMDQSRIIANAYEGKGGNIQITADQLIRTPDSEVSASSRLGIDGSVQIRSPETDVGGLLQAMPDDYLDAENWQRTPCAERRGESASRFVLVPREAIPTPFDDWLAVSPLVYDDFNEVGAADPMDQHAMACYRKGRFEYAIQEWEKALSNSPRNGEISSLTPIFIADAFQRRGFLNRAVDTLQRAMGAPEESDANQKAAMMNSLSDLHLCLGNLEKARSSIGEGIVFARESGAPFIQAALWNNNGNLAAVDGDNFGALEAYEKSVRLSAQSDRCGDGALLLKSTVLINLSRLRLIMEDYEPFNVALRLALEETKKLPDAFAKTANLIAIGLLSEEASRTFAFDEEHFSDISKQTLVHAYELAKALHISGIQAKILGKLGEHLKKERKLEDADSYLRKAISFAQKDHCPEVSYDLYKIRAQILDASGEIESARDYYKLALFTLNPIRSEFFRGYRKTAPLFKQIVEPVYKDYVELLLRMAEEESDPTQSEKRLAQMRNVLDLQRIAELEDYYKDECLVPARNMDSHPYVSDDRAVVIYPVPLKDKLILLLIFSDSMETIEVGVDARSLEVYIQRMRRLLDKEMSRPKRDLRSLFYAKKLHRSLIRPMEAALARRHIDTLVFCPSGQFRLIPFAALHDGNRFLIEKYAVAVIPSFPAVDTGPSDRSTSRSLIVGLSESRHGFPPLENVIEEMQKVQEKMGGHILSDEHFTRQNLTEELKRTPYTIIHMATHGHFGRTPGDTYLLAYDGKISLSDLNRFVGVGRYRDDPIELLTLSACQSALGDERAALGLAGVSLKAGAESAMATLWRVDDEAASELIGAFYAQLKKPGASKAEALQQAQIEMLNSKRFSHPAFWSPFAIIGKWL
jgi:filamentous hemagglutinin family protein